MRHKGIFAEILDLWSAAPVFADAHGRPWSAGEVVPLDFSRVMERLETSRIHDVLADLDKQLAIAVSAVSSKIVEGLQARMEKQIHGLQGNRLSPLPLSCRRQPSFRRRGRREGGLCMHAPMQVQVLGEMMNPKRLWKTDRPHDYRSNHGGTLAAQCQTAFHSIAVELDARRA